MAIQRFILEMCTGNDLYGEDYTKAAVRAVQDALHHSSITFFKSLGIDRNSMMVEVTIGVQVPDQIDVEIADQPSVLPKWLEWAVTPRARNSIRRYLRSKVRQRGGKSQA